MANTNSFEICRMTMVPAKMVFQLMEMRDIFFLSLTSKRTQFFIKTIIPKNQVEFSATIDNYNDLTLANRHQSLSLNVVRERDGLRNPHEKTHQMRNGLFKIHFYPKRKRAEFSWVAFVPAVCHLLTHLSETFNFPKVSFVFGKVMHPRDTMQIMSTMNTLSILKNRIRLDSNGITEESYTLFLDSCQDTKMLEMCCETPTWFEYSPRSPDVFAVDELRINDGHWVKLEEYLNCKEVELDNIASHSPFLAADEKFLNEIIKKSMNDEIKLKRLQIPMHPKALDFEKITEGLGGTLDETHEGGKCLKIQVNDGRKVMIIANLTHLVLQPNYEPDRQ